MRLRTFLYKPYAMLPIMLAREVGNQSQRKLVVALLAAAFCFVGLTNQVRAEGANGERKAWFRVSLEDGETGDGYRWQVGVSGPKGQELRRVCNLGATVDPPRPDVPYVESDNLKACGSLKQADDLAAITISVDSQETPLNIFEILLRPEVNKVNVTLSTGQRKSYLPKLPKIRNRAERDIPLFRYLIIPFEGDTCIRRFTTYDKRGKVLLDEARPKCR